MQEPASRLLQENAVCAGVDFWCDAIISDRGH
jgi:hypothetical protein